MAAAGQEDDELAANFESQQRQRQQQQQQDRIQTTNVDTSGCCDHNQVSCDGAPQAATAAAAGPARASTSGGPQAPSYANRPKRRRRTKEQQQQQQQLSQPQQAQKQQTVGVSLQDQDRSHQTNENNNNNNNNKTASQRPLILITEPESCNSLKSLAAGASARNEDEDENEDQYEDDQQRDETTGGPLADWQDRDQMSPAESSTVKAAAPAGLDRAAGPQSPRQPKPQPPPQPEQEDQFEVIDGISYRIVAAVTKRPEQANKQQNQVQTNKDQMSKTKTTTSDQARAAPLISRRSQSSASPHQQGAGPARSKFHSVRRKSSAFVANLLQGSSSFLVPQSRSSHAIDSSQPPNNRRMSIYEMTKSPPPETSIEMYLNERRRSSTVSAKFVQQQLEQQSTFESNYCARQQYFKDLNSKLINQDKKLLNVVTNRGQIHRHSVDIAQLPLFLAQSKSGGYRAGAAAAGSSDQSGGGSGEVPVGEDEILEEEEDEEEEAEAEAEAGGDEEDAENGETDDDQRRQLPPLSGPMNQLAPSGQTGDSDDEHNQQQASRPAPKLRATKQQQQHHLAPISEASLGLTAITEQQRRQQRDSLGQLSQLSTDKRHKRTTFGSSGLIVRRFQKFDATALSSAPSPDVKIGQRVAYKEYYGNEFGTIRWIGRVPQISPDWTVGVEFDNAIGEGDGSLNGRRYFIAKDCFAKFLPLMAVALVDQHVGRPEPGTMISVMSAAVRPGQMISIQRVSTVHVQHCFLNAPHRRPGAEFLAVNTRLHCQCPSCGPCAHVVKPPRTQRLMTPKNATHMCQFSTYTCCGMESSDEALCTYTGNRISSSSPPPPHQQHQIDRQLVYGSALPPIGNSWMEGSGYLSNLQAEQRKLMPEEYRLGAAPEDTLAGALLRRGSSGRRRRPNHHNKHGAEAHHEWAACDRSAQASPATSLQQPLASPGSHPGHEREREHKHHHHHHHHRHQHPRSKSDERRPDGPEPPPPSPVYANLDHQQQPIVRQLDQLGQAIDMQSVQQRQQAPFEGQTLEDVPNGQFDETSRGGLGEADLSGGSQQQQSDRAAADDNGRPLGPVARDVNGRPSLEANSGQPGIKAANNIALGGEDATATAATEDRRPSSVASELEALAMATRAVQYRDSIENRYLFPTDDIIDSTLEADLETLSQARYGRFGGARSSVSNCSSEEDEDRPRRGYRVGWRSGRGQQRKARSRNWRRNNNRNKHGASDRRRGRSHDDDQDELDSDLDNAADQADGRRRHQRRHRHRSHSSDDRDQDKLPSAMRRNIILKGLRSLVVSCLSAEERPSAASTPTNSKSNSHHHHQHYDTAATATAECCCRMEPTLAAAHFGSGQSGDYGALQAELMRHTSNEMVASHHHQVAEQLQFNKASPRPTAAAFLSWAAEEQINANYYMNLEMADGIHGCYGDDDENFQDEPGFRPQCDPAQENHQGLSQQQSEAACQASRARRRPAQPTRASGTHPDERTRRQISSSSDCGFSSASQNSMNLTNSNPSCSPTKFSEEEQRRLGQIYKRLAARLASGGSIGGGGGDDATTTEDAGKQRSSATSEDLFRLKRALMEIHSESCCQNTRCPSPHASRDGANPVTSHSGHEQVAKSEPSDCGNGSGGGRPGLGPPASESDESKGTLSRAFELKLTLSINPDPMATTTTATTTAPTATITTNGTAADQ